MGQLERSEILAVRVAVMRRRGAGSVVDVLRARGAVGDTKKLKDLVAAAKVLTLAVPLVTVLGSALRTRGGEVVPATATSRLEKVIDGQFIRVWDETWPGKSQDVEWASVEAIHLTVRN